MAIEVRTISPEWEFPLAKFFAAIRAAGERHFHPNPLTDDAARSLAQYLGRDLYYLLADGDIILAYGFLRGWDQGFEIPSLGIAVHPDARGEGLGELMMYFLHTAARLRGARQVRLKVYAENAPARGLYTKLGYRFDSAEEEGQMVGKLEL